MDKNILILGYVWPEPNTTAAGTRMLQLVRFFLKQDYKVTFASTAQESAYSYDLESLGVTKRTIRLNHSSFDVFLRELNPTTVLFDRFMVEEQFGWRVAQQLPAAIRILDTEDLHSLRRYREMIYKKNLPFSEADWLQQDLAKREMASIYRCDLSLIISSYEQGLLTRILQHADGFLLLLPLMYPAISPVERENWATFQEKKDFICIGNGKHAPNVEAIYRLKREIWPLIRRQLPACELRIYGAYLPEGIVQLHRPQEGFHIMGHAPDSGEVLSRARVNLAPLAFGAGIKGKLLEGMRWGTPSVSTPIGAEGIGTGRPWNGILAQDSADFAQAAVTLYQEEDRWEQAREHGVDIINSDFEAEMLQERLLAALLRLRADLEGHRARNFVGTLLRHHTLASTKYMAKWIEAKNAPH